jgi:predicted XRE-type DNA-binding protein
MAVRRAALEMILAIADRDGLTDYALEHCLGMTRPRASNLLHRRIEKFNTETLIDVLARLGVTVELTIVSRRPYLRWRNRNPPAGWRPFPGAVCSIPPDDDEPGHNPWRAEAGRGPMAP